MVFDALFKQDTQGAMQGESPYARMLEDPKFALGFGLLTSRENPLGAAVQVMGQGEQAKANREDRATKRDLLKYKMAALEREQSIPFQGNSEFAQIGNLVYQDAIKQGYDDFTARKYAIDKIRTGKSDLRIDPQSGMLTSVPRNPIFGGEFNDSQITASTLSPITAPHIQPKNTNSQTNWNTSYSDPVDDMLPQGNNQPPSGALKLSELSYEMFGLPPEELTNVQFGKLNNIYKENQQSQAKQPALLNNQQKSLNYDFEGSTGIVPYAKDAGNYLAEVSSNVLAEAGMKFPKQIFNDKTTERATINSLAGEVEKLLSPVDRYGIKSSEEMQKRLALRPSAGVEPSAIRKNWNASLELLQSEEEKLIQQNQINPRNENAVKIEQINRLRAKAYEALNGLNQNNSPAINNQSAPQQLKNGGKFLGFE